MRKLGLILMLAPMALGGCISSTTTPAPRTTTLVVPQAQSATVMVPSATTVMVPQGSNTTVICSNGTAPPCY